MVTRVSSATTFTDLSGVILSYGRNRREVLTLPYLPPKLFQTSFNPYQPCLYSTFADARKKHLRSVRFG